MKQKRIAFLVLVAMLLSGCQQENTSTEGSDASSGTTVPVQESFEKIDISTLQPVKGGYSQYSNAIAYYTDDEAKTIVSDTTNFHLSSECRFSVPKSIDHVSTFIKRYGSADSLSDFYRSYLEMYKYLFPKAEFDDNNLFYYGANSNNQNGDDQVKTVGKNFSEFISEDKKIFILCFIVHIFMRGNRNPKISTIIFWSCPLLREQS